MKVLVLGASGKTGGLVVERALAKGHEVSVLIRDPAKYKMSGVHEVVGDAMSAADVAKAMLGHDAVIDTIGGTKPYKKQVLERTVMRNIVEAARAEGRVRVIVVSALGVGESRAQSPWWYRELLLRTFLRGSTADKEAMEQLLRGSGLPYVIARPPILKDDAATGSVKVIGPGEIGHTMTRADLAGFLVEQLTEDESLGTAVTVVNS